MTASDAIGLLALALLKSVLVGLPRAGALAFLGRLRSPAWAAVLPGAIVIGTFLPLWHSSLATALVIAAAVATPLLAIVAIIGVARTPRALLFASALELLLVAVVSRSAAGQLTTSLVTALGRHVGGRRPDATGPGTMAARRRGRHGGRRRAPAGDRRRRDGRGLDGGGERAVPRPRVHTGDGRGLTVDYPDLVLAGVLGGAVAGKPMQPRAAVTLALLATTWGMLLALFPIVPATPPDRADVRADRGSANRRTDATATRRGACGSPARPR